MRSNFLLHHSFLPNQSWKNPSHWKWWHMPCPSILSNWDILFEVAMPITFKTGDSLIRLGLFPFFLLEILLLLSGTHEFPFISKFSTVLEFQKFSKILCKVVNIIFDYILILWVMSFYSFIYRLKSKWFALSLIWQWKFICLETTNQFLDFDFIKVFALLNCSHLCTEAL